MCMFQKVLEEGIHNKLASMQAILQNPTSHKLQGKWCVNYSFSLISPVFLWILFVN